jgi:formylglycine-generating enzyme required for sulfatase activity
VRGPSNREHVWPCPWRRKGPVIPVGRGGVRSIIASITFLFLGVLPVNAEVNDEISRQIEGRISEVLEKLLARLDVPECIGYKLVRRSTPSIVVAGAYRRENDLQEKRLRLLLSAVDLWLAKRESDYEHLAGTDPRELSPGESGEQVAHQKWDAIRSNRGSPEIMLFVELGAPLINGRFRLDLIALHSNSKCPGSKDWTYLDLPEAPIGRIPAPDKREPKSLTAEEIAAELKALASAGAHPSQPFRECESCPMMRAITGGMFFMGSPQEETGHRIDENGPDGRPLKVTIDRPFAIGMYEVTLGEFKTFVKETNRTVEGNCRVWTKPSWEVRPDATFLSHNFKQTDNEPAVCVSWNDAMAFVRWVNIKAKIQGNPYRLPSEAEWEYAARGGPAAAEKGQVAYWWGNKADHDHANYSEPNARPYKSDEDRWDATAPVNVFPLNPFGLAHMHGNVSEWVEDCWSPNHFDTPTDGSKLPPDKCSQGSKRVIRGGSWRDYAVSLRSASRTFDSPDSRYDFVGFRLARTLSLPPK